MELINENTLYFVNCLFVGLCILCLKMKAFCVRREYCGTTKEIAFYLT